MKTPEMTISDRLSTIPEADHVSAYVALENELRAAFSNPEVTDKIPTDYFVPTAIYRTILEGHLNFMRPIATNDGEAPTQEQTHLQHIAHTTFFKDAAIIINDCRAAADRFDEQPFDMIRSMDTALGSVILQPLYNAKTDA